VILCPWRYVGATLANHRRTRIQLCGKLVVDFDGRRIEGSLPGKQGRLLFAFLALNRLRPIRRDELMEVLWDEQLPEAADVALRSLLSKVRAVLGDDVIRGKVELEVRLPPDTWIDLEAALEAIHRAESAVVQQQWQEAWWPTRIALNVSKREFLPGAGGYWVEERRRMLAEVRLRTYRAIAAVGIGLGGSELASAQRSAHALIDEAPFHEAGYRFLMETLAAQGNVAEALIVYDGLRSLLREELGAAPAPTTQAVYRRLLEIEDGETGAPVRTLKTMLFIDMVGSTKRAAELGDKAWRELMSSYRAVVREHIEQYMGQEVDSPGDGFFATFTRPGDAIGAACAAMTTVRRLGVEIRAGVHAGECEVVNRRVTGIAVHVGARIAALASSSQILVSSTVRDLVAGSDIVFDDRGLQDLRGVPGEWHLFAVGVCSPGEPRDTGSPGTTAVRA
jgi:SARP family transcriptional regulator, regulator of embCAB operon